MKFMCMFFIQAWAINKPDIPPAGMLTRKSTTSVQQDDTPPANTEKSDGTPQSPQPSTSQSGLGRKTPEDNTRGNNGAEIVDLYRE